MQALPRPPTRATTARSRSSVRGGDIWTVNPDGTGRVQITTTRRTIPVLAGRPTEKRSPSPPRGTVTTRSTSWTPTAPANGGSSPVRHLTSASGRPGRRRNRIAFERHDSHSGPSQWTARHAADHTRPNPGLLRTSGTPTGHRMAPSFWQRRQGLLRPRIRRPASCRSRHPQRVHLDDGSRVRNRSVPRRDPAWFGETIDADAESGCSRSIASVPADGFVVDQQIVAMTAAPPGPRTDGGSSSGAAPGRDGPRSVHPRCCRQLPILAPLPGSGADAVCTDWQPIPVNGYARHEVATPTQNLAGARLPGVQLAESHARTAARASVSAHPQCAHRRSSRVGTLRSNRKPTRAPRMCGSA